MAGTSGDLELTLDDLRAVTAYALENAERVLPLFERVEPTDARPRAALDAARAFVAGASRSRLQRRTAVDAHRAAREVLDEAAQHAARAAGDAAAAAYLHPLAKPTQVGHILRAAAEAARAAELDAGDVAAVGDARVAEAARRAGPVLVDVLRRYPPAPSGRNRVAQLMTALDAALREPVTGAGAVRTTSVTPAREGRPAGG